VDRIFSLFGLYEILGYVCSGALVLIGGYVAFEGVPGEPGTAGMLGLFLAAYAVGHLVQTFSNVWESWLWRRGWPSARRIAADDEKSYGDIKRQRIADRISLLDGHGMRPPEQFSLARADLRSRGQDERAELMNTIYGFNRGLASGCWVMAIVMVVAGTWTEHFWRGIAKRASRFGWHFADQVWGDFVLPIPPSASH
jgi:hypothetical protein